MTAAAYQTRIPLGDTTQATADVMLVRPAAFGPNVETAASNPFQQWSRASRPALRRAALAEFEAVLAALRRAGVRAHVVQDEPQPVRPDALFPNNWVSFHGDGTAILYPLATPVRRPERRPDVLATLAERGFRVSRVVDLSPLERRGWYLEGTGSLVLDRTTHVAYAGFSARTHPAALARFAATTGYRTLGFATRGPGGVPVYHTNVLLSLGRGFAVVATAAIEAPDRRRVLGALRESGREIIGIDAAQFAAFAGNCLAVAGRDGPCLLLSTGALASLGAARRRRLARHAELVPVRVPTIERVGGGGIRCLLAEIFLPGGG